MESLTKDNWKEWFLYDLRVKHSDFTRILIKCLFLAILIALNILWVGFSYIALFFAVLFACTQLNGRSLYYIIFIFPLMGLFRDYYTSEYFISYVIVAQVLALGVKLLIDIIKKKKAINWPFVTSLAILVLYFVIGANWSNWSILASIMVGICILVLAYYYREDINFKELVFMFGVGIIISILISFIFDKCPRLDEFAPYSWCYSRIRFQGACTHVNVFAGEIVLFLALMYVLHVTQKVNWLIYPSFLIVMMSLINTYSKAAIIMFVVCTILYIIILAIKSIVLRKFIKVTISVVLLAAMGFVACFSFRVQTNICLARFSSSIKITEIVIDGKSSTSSGSLSTEPSSTLTSGSAGTIIGTEVEIDYSELTTGRFDIWESYIQEILKSPKTLLFGVGIGSEFEGYWSLYAGTSTHNTILQGLYYIGIVGYLLMALVLATTIEWKKLKRKGLIISAIIPFIGLGIYLMGVDFFSFRLCIYLFLVLFAFIVQDEDVSDEKEELEQSQIIPKKIHYIWLGGKNLPKNIRKCLESWKKYCPDYEIKRWDESNLDIDICNYCREAYDAKKFAFASDVLRFDILNKEGGIYLDIDVQLHKSLNELLDTELFMGFESEHSVAPGLILGASANNKHLEAMLKIYKQLKFIENGKLNTKTVCEITTEYLESVGLKINNETQVVDGIKLYASDYFCPYNPITSQRNSTKNTYATHLYLSSWYTKKQKLKNAIKKVLNFFTNGYFGLLLYKYKKRNIG